MRGNAGAWLLPCKFLSNFGPALLCGILVFSELHERFQVGHCKDCKHWHQALGHVHWNTCEAANTEVDYDTPMPEDGFGLYAHVNDDCGLSAGVKTGPLFGCIKFQAREA